MANVGLKDLLEAGVHFGHQTRKCNPKMKPYILCKRNTIHLIDIKETVRGILRAKKYITQVVSQNNNYLQAEFLQPSFQTRLCKCSN